MFCRAKDVEALTILACKRVAFATKCTPPPCTVRGELATSYSHLWMTVLDDRHHALVPAFPGDFTLMDTVTNFLTQSPGLQKLLQLASLRRYNCGTVKMCKTENTGIRAPVLHPKAVWSMCVSDVDVSLSQ